MQTCTQKCDNGKALFDMLQPSIFSFGLCAYVVMEDLNFPFSSKHQPGLSKRGDKILVFYSFVFQPQSECAASVFYHFP